MEKKLDEVNKRLEIFSELNDAYQALIDKLKGEQRNQTQKIERLQSMLEQQQRPSRSSLEDDDVVEAVPEQLLSNGGRATTDDETEVAARVEHHHRHHQSISIVTIDATTTEGQQDMGGEGMEECVGDVEEQDQLETEIIYDFVV